MQLIFDTTDMEKSMISIGNLIYHHTAIAADEIAEQTEKHTFPYVPRDEGSLEGGFKANSTSQPPLLQMDMVYSAKSNKGYDYAARQHEVKFHHKKTSARDHYLKIGFQEVKVEDIWARHLRNVL